MAFIDRIVEHAGRIKLTAVSGETDVYDMTREEGEVYTEGTLLNANNLNTQTQLDSAVESLFTDAGMSAGTYQNEVSDALEYLVTKTPFSDGIITNGNWNYIILGDLFIGMTRFTGTLAITSAVGSVYQSGSNSTITFPVTLEKHYFSTITIAATSYSVWPAIYSTSLQGIAYRAVSASSRASASYIISALTIGKIAS